MSLNKRHHQCLCTWRVGEVRYLIHVQCTLFKMMNPEMLLQVVH